LGAAILIGSLLGATVAIFAGKITLLSDFFKIGHLRVFHSTVYCLSKCLKTLFFHGYLLFRHGIGLDHAELCWSGDGNLQRHCASLESQVCGLLVGSFFHYYSSYSFDYGIYGFADIQLIHFDS
jgi:hypothetical protein